MAAVVQGDLATLNTDSAQLDYDGSGGGTLATLGANLNVTYTALWCYLLGLTGPLCKPVCT